MDKFYTVGDIPKHKNFKVKGSDIELHKDENGQVQLNTTGGISGIDFAILIRITDETPTDCLRPFFAIDHQKVIGCYLQYYLMDTEHGYVLEEFTPEGDVRFAQYFTPNNLDGAVRALQALMPEQEPEGASTEVTLPDGQKYLLQLQNLGT